MKRFLCFMVASLVLFSGRSQYVALFNNNGASVYMMPGSYMIVNTDSVNALENMSGLIQNAGDLRVVGGLYNDSTALLTGAPTGGTGLYDIGGNWVNNGTVTSYQDTVMFSGDATTAAGPTGAQSIAGRHITAFYDLILSGTTASTKTQELDATVSNILDLGTDELATQQYEMLVINPDPAAVLQANASTGSGYVSSLSTGRLSRTTNSTSAYIFPTGTPSSLVSPPAVPFYYRPVTMAPTGTTANIYGARLVDNPDNDSFFVSKFDDTLCSVNPHYYHRLYHTGGGNAADITMYFDASSDGYWTDMAHWDAPHANEWNYMGASTEGSGYGATSVEIPAWSNFTPEPFALAAKKFTVNAGPNRNVSINQTVTLDANITTSSIASIVWTPDTFLNNNTIADPTFTAIQTTEYIIVVTDESGCVARDTITLNVLPDVLLIPTAFSPNNDGVNDYLYPLNENLTKLVFQVYDRWGQKVYETDIVGKDGGWDGTFRGHNQDMGVYVWQAQYQLTGLSEVFNASGNVTLVR